MRKLQLTTKSTDRSVVNTLLRSVTLASKFGLVFILAKSFAPRHLGLYGIISAIIGYGVYIIGLEFYTFYIREIIGASITEIKSYIKSSLLLFCTIYVILLPFYIVIFQFEYLPEKMFYSVLGLLILEHLTQEAFRLLNALQLQIEASVVLFFKSGVWGIFFSLAVLAKSNWVSIESLLYIWIISSFVSLLIARYILKEYFTKFRSAKTDFNWVVKGVKSAAILLTASLITRGLFTFDRLIIVEFLGDEILGAFILFISLCLAIMTFLEASLISFEMPRLINIAKFHSKRYFILKIRKFSISLALTTFILAIILISSIKPLLKWISKDLYIENIYIFYWLLLNTVLYALALVPHIILFSFDQRRAILQSQVPGFILFIFFSLMFVRSFGIEAVLTGFTLNFTCVLLLKTYYSIKVLKND